MFDTKLWWQSRTIWLALIGILATILRFFEIEIDAADQGALADHITRKLKEAGVKDVRIEGLPQCDWVLVDAGDVIVHIFRPEVREFYNLERIWSSDAPPTARAATAN